MQAAVLARLRTPASTGSRMPTRMAITTMTTSNSINVKPAALDRVLFGTGGVVKSDFTN